MKITLQVTDSNPRHTHFTVFLNGANCGYLCTTTEEFGALTLILSNGKLKGVDTLLVTGKTAIPQED